MKYIIEEALEVKSEILNEYDESKNSNQKNYYISGIFSTPNQKNRNGRVYPLNLWEREVKAYQKHIQEKTINSLGEFDHPARVDVDPMQAVMRITEVYIKDGIVYGKAKILNNGSDKTNQLKALIDEGIKIGVSSRGVGSVKNSIVEEFKLTTWDVVSSPSDYNANLSGITESLCESIGNKEFTIEDDKIVEMVVCNKDGCHLFEKDDIQEATIQKFNSLLEEICSVKIPHGALDSRRNKVQAKFNYKDPKTATSRVKTLYFKDEDSARTYGSMTHYEITSVKTIDTPENPDTPEKPENTDTMETPEN